MENASAVGPRAGRVHRRGLRPGRFPLEVLVDIPDPANDRRLKTGPRRGRGGVRARSPRSARGPDLRREGKCGSGRTTSASGLKSEGFAPEWVDDDRLTWPEFAPDPHSSILRPGCGVRYHLDSAPGRLYTGQFGHTRRLVRDEGELGRRRVVPVRSACLVLNAALSSARAMLMGRHDLEAFYRVTTLSRRRSWTVLDRRPTGPAFWQRLASL